MKAIRMSLLTGVMLLGLSTGADAQQTVQLPARDKPLTDKPVTQFSIGAEDGEEWELLSGVRQVAFDAKDNLYVLDGNNYRVLVFDPNGKFVRKIGKQGGGPGELLAPVGMAITTAGQLVVADLGRRAYSIFKTDGTYVKNVLFEEGQMPALGTSGIDAHPRGGVVARINPMLMGGALRAGGASPPQLSGQTGERPTTFQWVNLDAEKSTEVFKVILPSLTQKVDDNGASSGNRRVSVMIRTPLFSPAVDFGALPNGGIAVMHEADYRIRIANNGQVERVIERPIKPRKVTKDDQRRAVERQQENMKNGTGMMTVRVGGRGAAPAISMGPGRDGETPSIDELLRDATFLEFVPVLRRLETDVLGRIWAGRTAADLGPSGPIDLIAQDGRYIGTVPNDRMPDAVSSSNRAAYIQRDDLGVEHVIVKRLPASWK